MSETMPVISIVVPVYKVEKYLDRCVTSLVRQTYQKLEIILVDDGSPDTCPRMCDEWAKRDSRIRVLHKSNGGLGDARNAGMAVATGQWIAFVDSDDYVDETAYEKCIEEIKTTGADVCYFFSVYVTKAGKYKMRPMRFPNTLQGKEIRQELLPKCYGDWYTDPYIIGSACLGIYKSQLIRKNRVNFVNEQKWISEEYIFTTQICYWATRIAFINQPLYYYHENEASITHSYQPDYFEKALRLYHNRKEDIQKKHAGKEAMLRADVRMWRYVMESITKEFCHNEKPFHKRVTAISKMCVCPELKPIGRKDVISRLERRKRLFAKAVQHKLIPLVLIMTYIKTKQKA